MSDKMQLYEGPVGSIVLAAAAGGLFFLWVFGVLGGIVGAILAALVAGVISAGRKDS